MRLDLAATWQEARHADLSGRTVVVIDVLRATTTMVTALDAGARAIYPVAEVEQARELAATLGPGTLLGGERGGVKLPGFDLGNSPREYTAEVVSGRDVVMTTTNGTSAINAAANAGGIVACSLGNVGAVGRRLHESVGDVTIICAGTEGRLSKDDLLCGGMLVSLLASPGFVTHLTDGPRIAMEWYLSRAGRAEYVLRSSWHGGRLVDLGFGEDIPVCARMDTSDVVPTWDGSAFRAE